MNTTEQIKAAFEEWVLQEESMEKGVKIASRRARNALLDMAKLATERRKEILARSKEE